MAKYKITYEDGILNYEKVTISAETLENLERTFERTIGCKKITNIKLLE